MLDFNREQPAAVAMVSNDSGGDTAEPTFGIDKHKTNVPLGTANWLRMLRHADRVGELYQADAPNDSANKMGCF